MKNNRVIDEFFIRFLQKENLDLSTKYLEAFHFELSEKLANELLDLVLQGKKRATASSVEAYKDSSESMPEIGDYSIITDWDNNPRCVIKTTNVQLIPFKEMSYDICKREGEDDTLKSWQDGHRRFYVEEGKKLGYTFDTDMLVVFEDFEVVYHE